jgi:hypothetical protein
MVSASEFSECNFTRFKYKICRCIAKMNVANLEENEEQFVYYFSIFI